MKYIKTFELSTFYDEKDIFWYIHNINLPKIKELVSEIPNINLNIRFSLYNVFKFLIESGADVNCTCTNGVTPLMIAARNKKEEFVQDLIDAHADLNIKNDDGETALIMISSYTDKKAFKIIENLIESGADWNISDNYNNTFLMHLQPAYMKKIIEKYPDKYEEFIKEYNFKNDIKKFNL